MGLKQRAFLVGFSPNTGIFAFYPVLCMSGKVVCIDDDLMGYEKHQKQKILFRILTQI